MPGTAIIDEDIGRFNGLSQAEPVPVSSVPASIPSAAAYASEPCRDCNGEGKIEHPFLTSGMASIIAECPPDPVLVDCEKCCGTGEITCDDHDAFKFDHGIDVDFRGGKQVVFFDYEGDGIFIWAFPYDTETDGQQCTNAERQSVYEKLWDWYRDWASYSPEDDR